MASNDSPGQTGGPVRTVADAPSLPRLFATAALTQRGRGGELPAYRLRRSGVAVDREHLLSYQRICGFTGGDVLPHPYPHLLGFPLQVQLMTDHAFPLPLPGLVHLENRITAHRRLTADELLDVTVSAEHLTPHPKGTVVDLVTVVEVAGERVWEGRSTYLRRGRGTDGAEPRPAAPQLPEGAPVGVVRVSEGLGRAYAAVSGDVNPIHLHALSARLMGFPRAIAHGMWTYARTLSVLGSATDAGGTSHVWFQKPVFLPSTVEVVVDRAAEPLVVGLRSAKDPTRAHLSLTFQADTAR
jgi:acyl dehydratase